MKILLTLILLVPFLASATETGTRRSTRSTPRTKLQNIQVAHAETVSGKTQMKLLLDDPGCNTFKDDMEAINYIMADCGRLPTSGPQIR